MPVASSIDLAALAVRLRIVNGRLHRRLRQSAQGELAISHLSALATIARLGPVGPSEVATAEQVSRPSMTSIVNALEAAGLVTRRADPADRRRATLTATSAGQRLLDRTRRQRAAYLARRLRELPEQEVRVLNDAVAILERLLEVSR